MTLTYQTLGEFKKRTTAPLSMVLTIESDEPGWTLTQLEDGSAYITARLGKRYAAFTSPYPVAVVRWLTRLVTKQVFIKRGVDPTDRQFDMVRDEADVAEAEIKEAADSNIGLFDLPLRADTTASGISKGGPYSYSEASPYVGSSLQGSVGRNEDSNGSGSSG